MFNPDCIARRSPCRAPNWVRFGANTQNAVARCGQKRRLMDRIAAWMR